MGAEAQEARQAFIDFNPAPICRIKPCVNKTVVRITDGDQRWDLCQTHGAITFFTYHTHPEIEIVDAWGGYSREQFEASLKAALEMSQEDAEALLEETKEKEEEES